jgi:hypothetical protein
MRTTKMDWWGERGGNEELWRKTSAGGRKRKMDIGKTGPTTLGIFERGQMPWLSAKSGGKTLNADADL